jgi:hypothetical protein
MSENNITAQGKRTDARQARLWEDTIVIALRDAQWLRCQEINEQTKNKKAAKRPPPVIPAGFIKLDGRAESKIGDVTLAMEERLFIIEVKSSKDQVRDEWHHRGEFRPKKVYARLSDLVDYCNQYDHPLGDDDEMGRHLMSSLNGHLIAYWDPNTNKETGQITPTIAMAPYLQAVVDSLQDTNKTDSRLITRLPVSNAFAVRQTKPIGHATPQDLGRDSCRLLYNYRKGKPAFHDEPLGLLADKFQGYVDFLCTAANWETAGEPINAIVLSSYGTFFQVVSSTNELADLLSINFVQERTPERTPKAVRERAKEQVPVEKDIEPEWE